jgi:signal transduction histidine kinase
LKQKTQGSVLFVDDDQSVLSFITTLLSNYGYSVISCESGQEALEKFHGNEIDAVLTDIIMPNMSGTELLGKIRDEYPNVPVILMTGYADLHTAVDAIKKGVFDFIIKPYEPEQIMRSLEKALRNKKMIEMERIYKQLLEEFNLEIENLISERTMNLMALTVADKVRNPATVIGYIGKKMLQRKDISKDFRENLSCIIEETEKLQNIVSDFHSLLKLKESNFKYEDINEVVEHVIWTLENKNVKILSKLSEQPLKINMQKNLLKVATYLLIKNSLEATPEGGTVSIETRQDTENTILEISDSGHGMSEDIKEKIFDPFFSTKKSSFGMGLPLVKQIIKEHYGKIEVDSKTGQGTTFRIQFPLRWTKEIQA